MADIDLPQASRYKDTPLFLDPDEEQPVFALQEPPAEFNDTTDFAVHRVRSREIGFLDQVAVRHYGVGNEILWWSIASANGMIDPENEMFAGQEIFVPPRAAAVQFVSRAGLSA